MLTVPLVSAIELRDRLSAVIDPQSARAYPDPSAPPPNPNAHQNIDPAIAAAAAAPPMMNSNVENGVMEDHLSAADGRKAGKRELSQSKRAAQNRAAQVCGSATSTCAMMAVPVHHRDQCRAGCRVASGAQVCSGKMDGRSLRRGLVRCNGRSWIALSILMSSIFPNAIILRRTQSRTMAYVT